MTLVENLVVRLATSDDAQPVAEIYGPVVARTAISFEVEPPSALEMKARMERVMSSLPWFVAQHDNAVVGYAYATPHRERPAYRWSVDTTVYIADAYRSKGVGRALYGELLSTLADLGYVTAFAEIVVPNEASVGLHEAVGFTHLGTFANVGYKLGRWHDVGWWQRPLRDTPANPVAPSRWMQATEP